MLLSATQTDMTHSIDIHDMQSYNFILLHYTMEVHVLHIHYYYAIADVCTTMYVCTMTMRRTHTVPERPERQVYTWRDSVFGQNQESVRMIKPTAC